MQPRMLLADCMMARTEACVSAGRPGSLHSSSAREARDAFMDAGSSGEGAGSGFGSGLGLGASSAARLRAKAQRMPCPPARRAQNSMARGRERVCLTEKAMMSNRENGTHSVPMRKDFTRRRCTHDCKPPQNSAYGNGIPKRISKTASPAPDTAGTSHDGFRDAPRATMQIRPR